MSWENDAPTPVVPAPKPPPRSLTHIERQMRFGVLPYRLAPTPEDKTAIVVDPKWEKENLETIEIPWHGGRRIRCHTLAALPIYDLFSTWKRAGFESLILTFNGCYVPRFKRGKSPPLHDTDLSNHSWGCAIDINARWNPLGKRPARIGETGSVELLVNAAYEAGFCWGGDFKTPDGMHFEFVGAQPVPAGTFSSPQLPAQENEGGALPRVRAFTAPQGLKLPPKR